MKQTWNLFLLLAIGFISFQCNQEEPEMPIEEPEPCLKVLGTYTLNSGLASEYDVYIELYDTASEDVFFKISNFNNQFDIVRKQYCRDNILGLSFNSHFGLPYVIDKLGHRYSIYPTQSRYIDNPPSLYLEYRMINIKYYIDDNAPYIDTIIVQDLIKK